MDHTSPAPRGRHHLTDGPAKSGPIPQTVLDLARMHRLPELRDPGDDWTGVTSTAERKKRQNRLNQRAYRELSSRLPLHMPLADSAMPSPFQEGEDSLNNHPSQRLVRLTQRNSMTRILNTKLLSRTSPARMKATCSQLARRRAQIFAHSCRLST